MEAASRGSPDGVLVLMRAALSLLSLAAGAVAGAAPILAAAGSLDGFLIFLAVWGFAPFALLALLSRWMIVPGFC